MAAIRTLIISTRTVATGGTRIDMSYGQSYLGSVTLRPDDLADFIEGLREGFTLSYSPASQMKDNRHAIHVTDQSMGSFIFGSAVPLGEWLDEGYETQYILTSQGGVNKSMLTDMGSRYSTTLTPRWDTPSGLQEGTCWFDGNSGRLCVYAGGRIRTIVTE